jgi:hypothetical protein
MFLRLVFCYRALGRMQDEFISDGRDFHRRIWYISEEVDIFSL